MKRSIPSQRPCYWTSALLGILLVATSGISRAHADEFEDEVRFISGLLKYGFPDFAEKVLEDVEKNFPGRDAELRSVKAEKLMAQRKFAEAEELVRQIPANTPEGEKARLTLGNYYYLSEQVDKAKAIYNDYFNQYKSNIPTDEGVLKAYRDAAFSLAQMLAAAEDYPGAINNIDRVLRTKPESNVARNAGLMKVRYALALARNGDTKLLKAIHDDIDQIEFGGPIWVARGEVLRAEALYLEGKKGDALELLELIKPTMKAVHESYEADGLVSESPKAGVYFVKGLIYLEEAMALAEAATDDASKAEAKKAMGKALSQFERIKRTYSEGAYGTDAIIQFNKGMDVVTSKLGAEVKGGGAAGGGKISLKQAAKFFSSADALLRKDEFDGAIREYVAVLNKFPETEASPRALMNLCKAYFGSGDNLSAKMVTEYLGERFSDEPDAANGCLLLAKHFRDKKNNEMFMHAYEVFAKHFPGNPKAALVVYKLAEFAENNGDIAGAQLYYDQLKRDHRDSAQYLAALNRLGKKTFDGEDFVKAREVYAELGEIMAESYEKANAMLVAGSCALQIGEYLDAARRFSAVVKALDTPESERRANPYYKDPAKASKVQTVLEQAQLQLAFAFSQMTEPADRIPDFRKSAVKSYRTFQEKFPKSPLMPQAMMGEGTVLLQLDKVDEGTMVFDGLSKRYPDSAEGKDSLITLANAAMSAGKTALAKETVQKMMADPDRYGPDQLAVIGESMRKNQLFDEAAALYESVRANSEDPTVQEFALYGLGESYAAKGDCAKAIEALEALLALNDKTGRFFDVKFLLARSYRDCKEFNKANASIKDIVEFTPDRVVKKKADLEMALIQEAAGNKERAYSSYQLIALHPNPSGALELKDTIHDAIAKCIEIGFELEYYDEVLEYIDTFVQHFPNSEKAKGAKDIQRQARMKKAQQDAAAPATP